MPSTKHLTVEVMGGLCSRLRAVVGGMAWCDVNDATLIVNWPSAQPTYPDGFQAKLSDLWKYDGRITEADRIQRLPKTLTGNAVRTCHIETFLEYFRRPIRDYMFRYPLADVPQKYFDHVKDSIPSGTVGVHIRYDIPQPGTASPEWFVERMRRYPESQEFFLSCDSFEVSEIIHRAFPERIYEINKTYRYDKEGIQKSMADLYVLSELCDWVIGANHSSYSQMCCFMRGGVYTGPHDRPNGVVGGRYEDKWNPQPESCR